jgi:hypothetical protein
MAGAPTKCTQELTEKFEQYLQMGNWIQTACALCDISVRTYYNWKDRGEAELERRDNGEDPDEGEECYVLFFQAVTRASAKAEHGAILAVRQGFLGKDGDWRAAIAYLERRYPDRWAKRRHVHHTGQIEHGSVLAGRLEDEDASATDLVEAYILEATTN